MRRLLFYTPFFLLALLLVSLPLLSSGSHAQDGPSVVGSDACQQCHEDQFKSAQRSIHTKKAVPGSPANKDACESCHGPGSIHVEKGGGRGVAIIAFSKKEDGRLKSGKCLACHDTSRELQAWDMGRHKSMDVSCDNCHSGHVSVTQHNLKAREPALCITCHKDVRAQLNRQARHPIQEGKVKCTDCHTPHGGFGKKGIRADSTPDLCYKCHTEKRGPFAYEHPPVAEDCGTCHQPHGSNHNGLLVNKVPQLCQNCHDGGGHTGRTYGLQQSFGGNAAGNKNKFFAQGCLNCHGNIHGSNRRPALQR